MTEKHYIFHDLQTGGFSAHTTISGLHEMLLDDVLTSAENEEDRKEWLDRFGGDDESIKRELICIFEYDILVPSKENVQLWEAYHGFEWEHEIVDEKIKEHSSNKIMKDFAFEMER